MKVIFMGTPDFAVPCLEYLIKSDNEVAGVFTQPDKPVGRKRILTPPPVKVTAEDNNIPVFQPDTLRNGEAMKIIDEINPDIIIVVAYGKILPEEIINYPKYGCINIHGSLLPKLRGAAPIQWSVINGDEYSGITSMYMDAGLDTGDMIIKREVKIDFEETAGELYDRLSLIGSRVLDETLKMINSGEVVREKQDNSASTYAPLLNKEISNINWNDSALSVYNKIRGLNPWPVASTVINGKKVKIYSSKYIENLNGKPGEIVRADKRLLVSCGDGNGVEILVLQPEGKKQMNSDAFLLGNGLNAGDIIGG